MEHVDVTKFMTDYEGVRRQDCQRQIVYSLITEGIAVIGNQGRQRLRKSLTRKIGGPPVRYHRHLVRYRLDRIAVDIEPGIRGRKIIEELKRQHRQVHGRLGRVGRPEL